MTLQQLEREMVAQPIRSLQYMLNRLSLRYDFPVSYTHLTLPTTERV